MVVACADRELAPVRRLVLARAKRRRGGEQAGRGTGEETGAGPEENQAESPPGQGHLLSLDAPRRFLVYCLAAAVSALPASSCNNAFRLKRILPVGSILMTFTSTCWPSLSSSRTSFTRWFAISETCSNPSVPGMISTNAPKSVMRCTLPM